jgi:hypothetical protein
MATNVTSDNQRNLHPAPNINETCCAYNLAKLTKDLNSLTPDDARYIWIIMKGYCTINSLGRYTTPAIRRPISTRSV